MVACYRIASSQILLSELVAAIVREHYPGARIDVLPEQPSIQDGVVVALDASDRWLFLATTRSPYAAMAEALASSACAVLTVGAQRSEFGRALACLEAGSGSYVPMELLRWMADQVLGNGDPKTHPAPPGEALTAREREILQLVARGYSNTEIARSLTISENTVRTHLHALSVKFRASSRAKMLANARAMHVPEAFDRPPAAAAPLAQGVHAQASA